MSRSYISITLSLSILAVANSGYGQDEFPILEGPYLGQKPPGIVPEVFAPSIIQTECFEAFGVFTPDMKEFYYVAGCDAQSDKLVVFKSENNRWSKSVLGPRAGEPSISPDGNTMHLGQRYMERTDTGWSEVKNLNAPFSEIPIMRLSASSNGTYYFDEATGDGSGVIRYSRLIDGKREEPRPLGKNINSGKGNAHPFIAPDGSYLIWDGNREGGYGGPDLYISYRKKDGSWGAAINLGNKINTERGEAFGSVTPDGKYLFFYRGIGPGNLDIFWVDAQFIENLRPKE